ncbi:MAG: GntR family transcriptional regulator [Candidatus Eremiobacteraeota bacterium]|nr:GntR family transcriptional regulator [Candidatus Eremiobacteraeota bacterium]
MALGTLEPGEQLPTVKALALDLTLNPNTVARAYRELERDAIIETSPGRGSFVRKNGTASEARRGVEDVAEIAIAEAVREARSMGVAREQVRTLFERALQRWFPTEGSV